jgi:hypothetical protein
VIDGLRISHQQEKRDGAAGRLCGRSQKGTFETIKPLRVNDGPKNKTKNAAAITSESTFLSIIRQLMANLLVKRLRKQKFLQRVSSYPAIA